MTNPNPGSDAAVAQGCTCPVMDNNHGAGASVYYSRDYDDPPWTPDGERRFWVNDNCPLHGRGDCAGTITHINGERQQEEP